jgi:hypothetical protein
VAKALVAAGILFEREHRVNFSCWEKDTWAQMDFILIQSGGVQILEVDEHQVQLPKRSGL